MKPKVKKLKPTVGVSILRPSAEVKTAFWDEINKDLHLKHNPREAAFLMKRLILTEKAHR